jgi:hypothetical protein
MIGLIHMNEVTFKEDETPLEAWRVPYYGNGSTTMALIQ